MSSVTWGQLNQNDYLAHTRPYQLEIYEKLSRFRDAGIPIEDAYWQGVYKAQGKIANDEEYVPCLSTAGLHYTLSVSSMYNPYKYARDIILEENRNGWDQRVDVPNAYSGTGYYMFRLDGILYLVYVNSSDEINMVESDSWRTNLDY